MPDEFDLPEEDLDEEDEELDGDLEDDEFGPIDDDLEDEDEEESLLKDRFTTDDEEELEG